MTKNCPECGAANPMSEEMCDHCGCTLVSPPPLPDGGNSCPSCKHVLGANDAFCDRCGVSVAGSTLSAQSDTDGQTDPVALAWDKSLNGNPPASDSHSGGAAKEELARTWKLTCVEGFHLGKEYLLFKNEMLLGRTDAESDIYPDLELEDQDDGYVSRRHAVIRINGNQVFIEDLGGENGSLLDGRPLPALKPAAVREGQVIRVGKVGLMLKIHAPKV